MNVLEKILKEIDREIYKQREICNEVLDTPGYRLYEKTMNMAKEIVKRHIDATKDENIHSNDDWIPVEERLPEKNRKVFVTVEHSSWIADFTSEWVPEKEKTYHQETSSTYIGYINDDSIWIFIDEEGQENVCNKEFGQNLGKIYDVTTHWQPLPKPYKPKKATASMEHIMSRFMKAW